MNTFCLDGKRALVTGGSKGIGLGIARGLAEAGADLVLIARHEDALRDAKESLTGTGRAVATYAFDMIDTEGIPGLFERIVAECRAVDILVNNAGMTRRSPAENVKPEDWHHIVTLNMTAVFALSQAFARERIASKRKGKIINIASLMSEAVRRDNAPYAATKGGIRQLTKALAIDWAPHGIHVNAIGPGYIRTSLTEPLQNDADFDAWIQKRTPLGRWGTPEDLAGAAVFLASAASDFVTGQVLYVDGGWLAAF